jgi:trehalose 6-phosphate phosphatase
MKDILSPDHRDVLEQFAWSNVVLAFDYDGTLAPIVDEPERAMMRDSTRLLLEELTGFYPCIVISGRSQSDALKRLRGVGIHEVIGNHGIEPWRSNDRMIAEVQRWQPILERHLAEIGGVVVEDKGFSVAIHYRQSREKKKALEVISGAVRALGEVRVIGGKQVVNVLPAGAPDKGTALLRSRARLHCDTAIYIGDDETDEAVFSLDQPGQLLAIRVGQRPASAAAYYVRAQTDVDELLEILAEIRRAAGQAAPPWRGR